jgi:hypothetical protein
LAASPGAFALPKGSRENERSFPRKGVKSPFKRHENFFSQAAKSQEIEQAGA